MAAGAFSLAFGGGLTAPQVVLEGYPPGLALVFFAVVACSVYAFVVIAGAYLGVVARPDGAASPVAWALLVACTAVPLAAAFREWLWWMVGTTDADAGIAQL